jgi:hypothetical protein
VLPVWEAAGSGAFTTIAVLLDMTGGLFSSGGVTSRPMLPFSAILIGLW